MKICKEVNINHVVRNTVLNVTITGVRRFKIRLFIGAQLIKLAALILGCNIQMEINQDEI